MKQSEAPQDVGPSDRNTSTKSAAFRLQLGGYMGIRLYFEIETSVGIATYLGI
jgi:hypothetical protein